MFTSIDDAVEVDVDLVRESEGERSQSSENREQFEVYNEIIV